MYIFIVAPILYVLNICSQMSLFKSRFLFTCSVIYSRALQSFRANSVWYSLCYTLQIVALENNRFRQWEQLWLYGGNTDGGGLEVIQQFNLTAWDQPNANCYTLGELPTCSATHPPMLHLLILWFLVFSTAFSPLSLQEVPYWCLVPTWC